MSDHTLIATTHIALWLVHRTPDDRAHILLQHIPGTNPVAYQPLRVALVNGQSNLEAAASSLAELGIVSCSPAQPLGYRYNLPLLANTLTTPTTPQCEEAIICAVRGDPAHIGGLRGWPPPAPTHQWVRALDAFPLVRYAEHVETLMRLWQMWAKP